MPGPRPVVHLERKRELVEEKLVRAIQQVGPKNIALLSRLTGAHPETIRYKVKRQFKKLGLRIHASVDYRRLGLVPYWADLRFSRSYGGSARDVFLAMNKTAYLVYYGKLLPQGNFACLFVLPAGKEREHRRLLDYLKKTGVLESYDLNEIVASRATTMNPHFFNFRSGGWEVDWNAVRSSRGSELPKARNVEAARLDSNDLLLIKELQMDAFQHLVSIAKKVRVHSKTLEYHYRAHVQKEKMVAGYLVRWMHDVETSVAHAVQLTRMTFTDLGDELGAVQRAISKVPFLWAEEVLKDGKYVATLCIPVRETTTTLDYLNSQVPDLYYSVGMALVKRSEASWFTIPYNLFKDGWVYDSARAMSSLRSIKRKEN